MSSQRRFPPPWKVHEIPGGYRLEDSAGVSVAWIYARDDLRRHTNGEARLTTDAARRIAAKIARLPQFLLEQKGKKMWSQRHATDKGCRL